VSTVAQTKTDQIQFEPGESTGRPTPCGGRYPICNSLKSLVHEAAAVLNNDMPREFSLHIGSGGKCVIKEDGDNTMSEFIDILAAVMYVRQQTGSETAVLTIYDAGGREAFKRTL
jgi:hypothetical protein